jgi:hypothetical protein
MVCLGVLTACNGASSGPNGGSNPPPSTPDSISGTVSFRGAALAGATVTNFLTNENVVYQVTTTDADGNYSFTGMQTMGDVDNDYQIYVNKAGYGFYPSVGGGAKVTRADYTGQFQGSGIAPSGLFFTVIDFVSLPDSSVTGANFAAYNGSNPRVTLPATGQQISYGVGDDGSKRKGVAWSASTRFTDNYDGTIEDTLTGLIWLKDAGCLGAALWSNALISVNQLSAGSCGLTDASTPGQWRMPNLIELESLIDASSVNPALPASSPFFNVSNGVYWSSTSYYGGIGGSGAAWTIRFGDGRYMNDSNANLKASANNNVWAVKGAGDGVIHLQSTGFYRPYEAGDDGSVQSGVPLTSPRFVDHSNGSVTDTVTGLIWLKQADCIGGNWSDALAAVHSLASGQCGLTDGSSAGVWRMPNRNELQSLADRMQTNLAQYFNYTYLNKNSSVYQAPIFTNDIESEYYWTSTTDAADPTEAWTVFSCDFGVYDIPKTNSGYTLAVR